MTWRRESSVSGRARLAQYRLGADGGLRRGSISGRGLHAARTIKTAIPIRHFHIFYPHFGARFGGVNEFALTDVDADVAESVAHGVEEHQVAGPQVSLFDLLGGGGLLLGSARQNQADRLLEHSLDESTTVKTAFDSVAAAPIGHAQKAHGGDDQLRGGSADRAPDLVNSRQKPFVGQQLIKVVVGTRGGGVRSGGKQKGGKGDNNSHGA